MKAINVTRKTILSKNIKVADTFLSRMIGLLNRSSLNDGEGLLITHCQSIHMVFMRFPIDVVFINKEHQVVGLVKEIEPFSFSPFFRKASYAIELPTKAIEKSGTLRGDFIQIVNVE